MYLKAICGLLLGLCGILALGPMAQLFQTRQVLATPPEVFCELGLVPGFLAGHLCDKIHKLQDSFTKGF